MGMERLRITEDEAGISRIQAVKQRRFLFWAWESTRWYGGDGIPKRLNDKVARKCRQEIVDEENDKRLFKNPKSIRVVYDPLAPDASPSNREAP